DRSGAHPARPAGLPGGTRQRRGPGVELREGAVFARLAPVIGALGRGARLDAGEALVDVGDETDAAHLAIGDDIDAGLGLLFYRFADRCLDPGRVGRLVDCLALLLLQ